ncbi:MAG: 1,4-beta-xylanase [Acidobacteria bacterium]|nr:MAG: 1,4-beta-xylanase [Acidobacteriota bacterium]
MSRQESLRPWWLAVLVLFVCATAGAEPRWSAARASEWSRASPWAVGCNFIPSTAINQLEMWQADTFDLPTIDRELGWAEGLGFTSVLFDSCWNDNARPGPQPAPKPGVHNSGWVRAPGTLRLFDSRTWGGLEAYTRGVVGGFAGDPRVLAWDLFNEPSNSGYMDAVVPLLKAVFAWAREANPEQPLTSGLWNDHPMSNEVMLANSDVVTFHDYDAPEKLEAHIQRLAALGRPLLCTEYMARTRNSTFEGCLPVFKRYGVGAINWGLVKGKTNTIFAWNAPMPDKDEPPVWFHDVFRPDGTPFRAAEAEFIRAITKATSPR